MPDNDTNHNDRDDESTGPEDWGITLIISLLAVGSAGIPIIILFFFHGM